MDEVEELVDIFDKEIKLLFAEIVESGKWRIAVFEHAVEKLEQFLHKF